MLFNSWKSSWMIGKEYGAQHGIRNPFPDSDTFYLKMVRDMMLAGQSESANLGQAEMAWYRDKQPYYNVWPGIIDPLTRIDREKVPSTHLHMSKPAIVFRLAADEKRMTMDGEPICCVLVSIGRTTDDTKTGCKKIMTIFAQTDRMITLTGGTKMPHMSFSYLGIREDLTVQQAWEHITTTFGTRFTADEKDSMMRLVSMIVGICLLSTEKEDELIVPDVLGADRVKYEETQDDKYVEKAHRRGKVGWDVGKHLTVSPHWRIGHMMLLKAGVAHRQQSRLVWRRGTMVKRTVASQLPTGYEGMPGNKGELKDGLEAGEAGASSDSGAGGV